MSYLHEGKIYYNHMFFEKIKKNYQKVTTKKDNKTMKICYILSQKKLRKIKRHIII
jgi:hypothetical protein